MAFAILICTETTAGFALSTTSAKDAGACAFATEGALLTGLCAKADVRLS